MARENYFNNNSNNLNSENVSKSRKKAVIILPILFLLIIVFSFWQFVIKVNKPFQFNGEENIALVSQQNTSADNLDTDKDGISDYDEVFVYKTSPYLEDSDGDDILDYIEIFSRKTDPNCVEGQDCFSADNFDIAISATSSDSVIGDTGVEIETDLGNITADENINEEELKRALAGEVDAETLRQLLLDSGADAEVLKQISDEDLLASYQEVLNNQNEN